MTTCTIGYELDSNEYFYTLIREPVTPSVLHAYSPKLMPKIGLGSQLKTSKGSISRSIFCNDSSCRPAPSSTITFQNYITLPHYPNENPSFSRKALPIPYSHLMEKHNKFLLSVLHNDVRQLYFTGKV